MQAESVANIISAQGEAALNASYNVLEGSLSKKINSVLDILEDCSSNMAAWVDYPDEEIPDLSEDVLLDKLSESKDILKNLLDNYENGQATLEGIETAIIGKTNVGKSTLMNLLAGREKSIVSDFKGTTRDIIEDTIRMGDIVLRLCDTAGLRQSNDEIESIGINLAEKRANAASLILPVFDNSSVFDDDDAYIIEKCKNKKCIAIVNKMDLPTKLDIKKIKEAFDRVIYISAKDDNAISIIAEALNNMFEMETFDSTAEILANKRQKNCCEQAASEIDEAILALTNGITYDAINVIIDSAIDKLLCLTGKKASEEVVNNIFSKFCVGK